MVWWIECAAHSKDSAVAARECSLVKVDLVDGALDVVHRRGCRMDAALDLELSDWYANRIVIPVGITFKVLHLKCTPRLLEASDR